MKIVVIVTTRGRHQRAAGVVECARNLLSGRHEVQFVVALDSDDILAIQHFTNFAGVTPYIQPRPIGVGDVWNRAARAHPADFYLALPDDAWIVTPGWDAMMVQGLTEGTEGNMLAARLGILVLQLLGALRGCETITHLLDLAQFSGRIALHGAVRLAASRAEAQGCPWSGAR